MAYLQTFFISLNVLWCACAYVPISVCVMSLIAFVEVCMSLILEHSVTACINITEEITVRFRTSEVEQFPGFEMNVVCYRPDERDLPGKW